MSSLSCLRGSQACLNCLLASKPLICKLAPLVLSPSTPIPSLCSVCPPLSLPHFVCMPLYFPSPVPSTFPLSVSPFTASFCLLLCHDAPLYQKRRHYRLYFFTFKPSCCLLESTQNHRYCMPTCCLHLIQYQPNQLAIYESNIFL